MPELMEITKARCPSTGGAVFKVTSKSEPGKVYFVEYGQVSRHEYGWTCNGPQGPCKGFQYNGKCRHIAEGKERWCGWDQFMDGGEPANVQRINGEIIQVCPECREYEVTWGSWAV